MQGKEPSALLAMECHLERAAPQKLVRLSQKKTTRHHHGVSLGLADRSQFEMFDQQLAIKYMEAKQGHHCTKAKV